MKRLIIFDFDGTLADSLAWFTWTMNRMALRYGFKQVQPQEADRLRGLSTREIMAHLEFPAWRLPAVLREMRRAMEHSGGEIGLFPGVDALLESLAAAGRSVAVVTSNSAENVKRVLGDVNLARVQYLECGASLFGKRAKLRAVLKRSRVPAAEALCVGDELRDAEAARAAGIDFAAVSWGFGTLETLASWSCMEPFANVDQMRERLSGG